ncbi:MAG: phosphoenolpyruvate carboxylase, partial [Paracoccaceae bacterium]
MAQTAHILTMIDQPVAGLLPEGGASDLRAGLFRILLSVAAERAPDVARYLRTGATDPIPNGPEAIPYLQALNIWFQLQKIAEENATMRDRRRLEAEVGASAVPGSFSMVLDRISGNRPAAADIQDQMARVSIAPTITAHPTEAKRVTILENHRRIYRRLVDLENQRWTPREQARLVEEIRDEIDLLWLTGELRLERPSLDDEVAWGLQFFHDSLYEAVPQFFDRYEEALQAHCADASVDARPSIQFHSWIGGDRDGNPNVTSEVTARSLAAGRQAALASHIAAVRSVGHRLSVSARIAQIPAAALAAIRSIVPEEDPLAQRNPGELFR